MPPHYDPANPSSPEVRRRAFRLLFLCLMATGIGNSMLFAILPPLARELAVPEIFVGAIYTVSALLFLIVSPLWGALSDTRGRRPMIVFGLSSFAVSTLIFAAAAWSGQTGLLPPLGAFMAMAFSRALFGGLGSATNPSAQAYVADRTSPHERTEALAGLTAAFGLGGAIGPALAGAFVDRVGIAPFLIGIAAIVAMAAVAVRTLLPENTPPREKQGRSINPLTQFAFAANPRILPFMVFGVLIWLSQAASLQAIGFYVMDRLDAGPEEGLQLAGVTLTAGASALIFAQLAVIPALKASPRTLMIAGGVLIALGNIELAFAGNYAAIVFGFLMISFGFGLARSGFTGGASISVDPGEQGQVAGLTTATAGAGFLFAPLAGLWLYQAVGPQSPFLLNGVLAAMGAALALFHPRVRAAMKIAHYVPTPKDPV